MVKSLLLSHRLAQTLPGWERQIQKVGVRCWLISSKELACEKSPRSMTAAPHKSRVSEQLHRAHGDSRAGWYVEHIQTSLAGLQLWPRPPPTCSMDRPSGQENQNILFRSADGLDLCISLFKCLKIKYKKVHSAIMFYCDKISIKIHHSYHLYISH